MQLYCIVFIISVFNNWYMLTFNVMTHPLVVDQIRTGVRTSFSNKNYRHIFQYVLPGDLIRWNVRGTNDNVWTQVDSVSKIYKSNLLFLETSYLESTGVQGHQNIKQRHLSDNIVVHFYLV